MPRAAIEDDYLLRGSEDDDDEFITPDEASDDEDEEEEDTIDVDNLPPMDKEEMMNTLPWQHDMFFLQEAMDETEPKGQLLVEGTWLNLFDVFPTARSEMAHTMPKGFVKGLHCHAWRYKSGCSNKEACNFIHAVAERGSLAPPPRYTRWPSGPGGLKRTRAEFRPQRPVGELGRGIGRGPSGGTEARLEYLPSGVLPVSVVAHRQSAGITPLPHRPVVGEHVPVIGRGVGRDEMDSDSDSDSTDSEGNSEEDSSQMASKGSTDSDSESSGDQRYAPRPRLPSGAGAARAKDAPRRPRRPTATPVVKEEPLEAAPRGRDRGHQVVKAPPARRGERRPDTRELLAEKLRHARQKLERAPAPGPSKAKERSHRVVSRPGRSTAPPPVKDEPSEEEEEKKVIIKRPDSRPVQRPAGKDDYRRKLREVQRKSGRDTAHLEYDPERPQPMFRG